MKNNEMVSSGIVSFIKLPEKFADAHPVAAAVVSIAPVVLPHIFRGAKYVFDRVVECYQFKVMAEHGMAATNIVDSPDTIIPDDTIAA